MEEISSLMMMEYILTAVLYVICLLGFTANLIIVAVSAMKWKSLKSLPTCDKILSSLAVSRGLYFFGVLIQNSIFKFQPWLMQNNIMLRIQNILSMFLFYSSNWIVTILGVFYSVKIVTYNYKLFIFLKTRISTMAPWLIQAALLISLICSLPFGWYGYGFQVQGALNGSIENMTKYRKEFDEMFSKWFWMFVLGSYPPFIIFCVANLLPIHFLLMHTRRMRSNGSHIQSPNLQSHFSALKSMSLFLLLQIMYFVCKSLSMSGNFFFLKFPILILIIHCIPPLFHSLHMVASSSEVQKMLILMCPGLFKCS